MQSSRDRKECRTNETEMDAQQCKWYTPFLRSPDIKRYAHKEKNRIIQEGRKQFELNGSDRLC
jgi:hypothetical protein